MQKRFNQTTPCLPIIQQDLFYYSDGYLYWKIDEPSNGRVRDTKVTTRKANDKLNTQSKLAVNGRCYNIHRLIWALHFGEIPEGFFIDHISGNRRDDRIENLRLATPQENCWNTASKGKYGKGVHKNSINSWSSAIVVSGVKIKLGTFKTRNEASEAYREASLKYHNEFSIFYKG
jgi:hypothetical protein